MLDPRVNMQLLSNPLLYKINRPSCHLR